MNTTSPGFPDRITTLDGKTYEKVILEKVDPDGLLVLFAPVEWGSGTAKLKFRNLPAELRERYAYDPPEPRITKPPRREAKLNGAQRVPFAGKTLRIENALA